jgi:hypothetical protein
VQRPIADTAFTDKVTVAAWKSIPSSFVFGRYDRAIDPAELAFLARRAGGPMTILNGLAPVAHQPRLRRRARPQTSGREGRLTRRGSAKAPGTPRSCSGPARA